MSRASGYVHCPRCRRNMDAVLCPRCGVLTERGRLAEGRAHKVLESEVPVYTLHLKRVRDGGVDVEAS